MIVNKPVTTDLARAVSTKPYPIKEDQKVQSLASSVSRFFSSYRSTAMWGFGMISIGAAIGYWSGKIPPDTYRQIVIGNISALWGYETIETGLSTFNPDVKQRSELETRLAWREWAQKPSALEKPAMLALLIGSVPLGLAILPTYGFECYAAPELILPRVALTIVRACAAKLNQDLVELNDKSILKDLEQKKWHEYSSIEEFDRKLDLAYSRLLQTNPAAAFQLGKDYSNYLDATPSVNREQALSPRAHKVLFREMANRLGDLKNSAQKA